MQVQSHRVTREWVALLLAGPEHLGAGVVQHALGDQVVDHAARLE